MNKIRIPIDNKFFPIDTYRIYRSIKEIKVEEFKNFNFYFLFNLPNIIRTPPEKIRINDDIQHFKWNKEFLKDLNERKTNIIKSLENNGYKIEKFQSTCLWRLIIGLGSSHPQETSMILHHVYGIPYIPGSAVKGVTRHWTVLKFADVKAKNDNEEFEKSIEKISNALENGEELDLEVNQQKFTELIEIFGTQKQHGKVIFMDAYPVENVNLKLDIMNPHYPDYYSGNEPPADWQNPNPIKFLTVEKTKFQFYLLSKSENLLNMTKKLLQEALLNYGIGAKTSIGYGLFKDFE